MDLMNTAREFVMGLPEALQGVGVFLVSFIPFVEGEGAAIIGVVAGISPWLAVPVGIVGNLLVVALLVYAAPAMVSFGAGRDDVMVWQVVAIVLYTAVGGLLAHGLMAGMGVQG